MGRAGIRPPTPFFWRRRRGRRRFGVDKTKNCSGYCRGATGLPGTYYILVQVLPGLRVIPSNCSGYYTRALTTRQAAPGHSFFLVFSCCIPAAWDNNPNNCSLCCLGCCWGFGIRGSGFGVSGSGIGIYVYIPLFIYILSIIFFFFFRFF